MSYTAKDIVKLSDIDAIRKNTSMYIGSTETPTHLVMELIDNVFDEIQAGFCKEMLVEIYTDNSFAVTDWGRGFPFDEKLPIEKDPPVLSCMEMSTSGKFYKDKKDSPYKIASGLHGIGLTAVNALSTEVVIEIYRDNKYAKYTFNNSTKVTRNVKVYTRERPFATRVYVKPNPKYFKSIELDTESILTRLKLAKIEYPETEIVFKTPDKAITVSATVEDFLKTLVDNKDVEWNYIEDHKGPESYRLWFTWDFSGTLSPRVLSSVNLVLVHQGVHINKVYQIIRDLFQRSRYNFYKDDCFIGFRMFLVMKLVNTAFDAQVKVRLESKSDISILERSLPQKLKAFFDKEKDYFNELCRTFEEYRKSRISKTLKKQSSKTRLSTTYTKLRDCLEPGGELLIGEGESAISGLLRIRDVRKHAILPLRGVVPNSIVMDPERLLNNDVMKDLVTAVGTGIIPHCNIEKIRYSKILIACDADPAGKFISALLVMFFVKYMPDVIKHGYLYVCETPLYGIGRNRDFRPIWTKEEADRLKREGKHIRRFKGLGEFNPEEIYQFTLGDKRKLVQVKWYPDKVDLLFDLFSKPDMKRKLLDGQLN